MTWFMGIWDGYKRVEIAIRLALAVACWPKHCGELRAYTHRLTRVVESGDWEYTLTLRRIDSGSVSYSREELVKMLAEVRRCEVEMNWRVPEPWEKHLQGIPAVPPQHPGQTVRGLDTRGS